MSTFEKYYTELYKFLTRKLRDSDQAEDLAQETFSRALTVTEPVKSPRSLLYKIARNLLIDHYRRPEANLRDHPDDDEDAIFAAPSHLQPYERLAENQYTELIVKTIEALPPRCREAFILHRLEGLSQQEVAKQMGISTNMVEKHIIRAMMACRACNISWQQHEAHLSKKDKDGRYE